MDQQEADASLGPALVAGSHQAENPFSVLAQRGPGFLAVDDVLVAPTVCLGFNRSQIRAGAGLAVALAPPDLATGDARQYAPCTGQRAFFFEQMFLHRVPARAAECFGPSVTEPTFFTQNFSPALYVV